MNVIQLTTYIHEFLVEKTLRKFLFFFFFFSEFFMNFLSLPTASVFSFTVDRVTLSFGAVTVS